MQSAPSPLQALWVEAKRKSLLQRRTYSWKAQTLIRSPFEKLREPSGCQVKLHIDSNEELMSRWRVLHVPALRPSLQPSRGEESIEKSLMFIRDTGSLSLSSCARSVSNRFSAAKCPIRRSNIFFRSSPSK